MATANTTGMDGGPMDAAGVQLERFAAGLDERERVRYKSFF